MVHDTQSVQISQKQDEHDICVIMKIMYPPGYPHNGFVATHVIYIYIYMYTYITCNVNQVTVSFHYKLINTDDQASTLDQESKTLIFAMVEIYISAKLIFWSHLFHFISHIAQKKFKTSYLGVVCHTHFFHTVLLKKQKKFLRDQSFLWI